MAPPTVSANLAFNFDASNYASINGGATVNGELVTTWSDLSGNSRHATQTTGAAKPVWIMGPHTSLPSGLPIVRFDGVDDILATPAYSWPANFTVIVVARSPAVAVGNESVIASDVSSDGIRMFQFRYGTSTSLEFIGFHTGGSAMTDTQPANSLIFQRIMGVRRPTEADAYVNNVSNGPVTNAGTPVTGSQALFLGSRNTTDTFGQVDIAEILVYDDDLSSTDATTIDDYLVAKWFESLSMPPTLTPQFDPTGVLG